MAYFQNTLDDGLVCSKASSATIQSIPDQWRMFMLGYHPELFSACPTACTESTTRTSHLPGLPNPFVPMAASQTLFSKPSSWNCESHHDACASNALRFRCKLSNNDKKRAARPQDKGFQLEMGRPGLHVIWHLVASW